MSVTLFNTGVICLHVHCIQKKLLKTLRLVDFFMKCTSYIHYISEVLVNRSLVYVYVLQIVVYPFVLFLLAIVLSVLLRFTDSDLSLWYLQTLFTDNHDLKKTMENGAKCIPDCYQCILPSTNLVDTSLYHPNNEKQLDTIYIQNYHSV